MRILMLTPWYPDDQNAMSGLFIRNQALALAAGNQVLVISAKVDYHKFSLFSYALRESEFGPLKEYRLRIFKSLPLYNQLNHLLITFRVSLRIAKSFQPDVIHASIGFPGAIWGWTISRRLGKPFVVTEHTQVTNNFRSFFHKALTLKGYKKANVVMAVSHLLASELTALLHRHVAVVPNVVDIERFSDVQPPAPSSVWQLGFLGGLNTPVKGLDILLRALSKLRQDFVLHIGGAGSLSPQYQALAAELKIESKCRFYGFVQPADLPSFMARLHFMICSSRYESFCVSLVEAMACGLPVVSTRCGGPEDFVTQDNGILCEKDDPEKLREAIEQMMRDHARYSSDEIRRFTEKFSAENVREAMMKSFKELI